MFWLDESHPAGLAPGKRPRTTLSPALALRDGEPYLVFGTPGGDQQDQWALHVFLRHVHFGMNLQEAIDAPAFHTEHAPSSFYPRAARPGHLALEGRFPAGNGGGAAPARPRTGAVRRLEPRPGLRRSQATARC